MTIADIVLILIFIFGMYLGYQSGFLKQLNDLVILFVVSIAAGMLSDFIYGFIYNFFPFFNFVGKSEGIKSINIILWKLILYLLIIGIIISIIRKIYKDLKIEEKLTNNIIEAGLVSKIFGIILSIPLMFVLSFNIILVFLSPNFNLTSLSDSKISGFIMEKTPVLSQINSNLYENEKFIIEKLNEDDITPDNYEIVNEDIITNITDTELISYEMIENLGDKLLGKRKESTGNDSNDEENSEDEDYSDEDYSDEEWSEDEDYSDEDYSDEEWSEDEDYSDEDYSDEEWSEDEDYSDEDYSDEEWSEDEDYSDEDYSDEEWSDEEWVE